MKAAHTIESSTGLNKKTGAILAILAFTLVAMIVGYFLVNQVQNPAKRADEGEGVPLSGPNCPANGFTCKWTREPGVGYHYSIKEGDGTIVKEGDIPASSGTDKITVTHTPQSGKTYTCAVVASNDCGTTSDEKSASCSSSPQPTIISSPTPTLTVTPSVTPTGALTPTLMPTVTLTPTSGPSPTLPPNVTPSKTPTPTDIIIVNATNTPKPGQPTSTPKATSNPTLPTTGGIPSLPALTIILVGFIIVTLGLVL